ncbi:hypothetical protein V6L77_16360 [Pannonibacter sp. Pt2-lr]
MTRVSNELDAVVEGTEGATESILSAAEFIDETANTLSARVSGMTGKWPRTFRRRSSRSSKPVTSRT